MTATDEDQQEVVVDEPAHGEFFGLASMLQQTGRQTAAMAFYRDWQRAIPCLAGTHIVYIAL